MISDVSSITGEEETFSTKQRYDKLKELLSLTPVLNGASIHALEYLQNAGLIRYKRGRITIVDRPGLESRVCECYQVVKTECDRLDAFRLNPFVPGA